MPNPTPGQGGTSDDLPPDRSALKRRRRQRTGVAALLIALLVGILVWTSVGTDSGKQTVQADRRASTSTRPATTARRSTSSATSRRPSTSTAKPSTAPKAPPRAPTGPEITIAFAGDNNGEGLAEADMANAMAGRLGPMKDLLSNADLTVANLETAITSRGQGASKEFTFRSPPTILNGLQSVGVDVVSMANNHGLDFGPDGLADSLAAKRTSPIPIVGIGADDAEAFAPARLTVKGLRVAVIGVTQVLDSSLITAWTATADHGGLASAKRVDRLLAEVRKAKEDADIVIVFLHWGTERNTCPNPAQQELAKTLAAAGTTLIVGGHAHRVQSGGFLGTSFVDYGLGNFGFYAGGSDAARTGVLTITLRGSAVKGYEWHPGVIRDRTPYPLTGAAAQQAVDSWNQLRSCTNLTPAPT